MIILGTKFFGHDSAIFRIDSDKKEIFALSTERFTRNKHDASPVSVMSDLFSKFSPPNVICHSFSSFEDVDFCLETKSEGAARAVEAHEQHTSSLKTLLASDIRETADSMRMKGVSSYIINKHAVDMAIKKLSEHFGQNDITHNEYYEHHLCHAVSAYYSSPYFGRPCLVLSVDGQGDGFSGKAYIVRDEQFYEIGAFPVDKLPPYDKFNVTSLGSIYANFTEVAGFRRNSDEGKVEALAAFGRPIMNELNALRAACHVSYNYLHISPEKILPFYDQTYLTTILETHGRENFCATIQKFLEDVVVDYINALSIPNDVENLCLAGGVAANIIMNLNIYERTKFKSIHVAPYMGDEGTACGAAILSAQLHGCDVSWIAQEAMPYFGVSYSRQEVLGTLKKYSAKIDFEDIGQDWPIVAAKKIANSQIIAIFHGKMEFGPRALGNRSILANPSDPNIRKKINVSIKRRPPWQPFCPSILESERERLFISSFHHKHMAIAFRLKKEFHNVLPSAVHIDGTARPQFVMQSDNPEYFKLLKEMKKITGLGVVINTSFNLHGRAMVMTPEHALDDFLDCNLDFLFIEGYMVWRRKGGMN